MTNLPHPYVNPPYRKYYLIKCEEVFRKLPRTISQDSANVSMNKTFINLLQQNRAERKKRKGKKVPSGMVVNEEIPQEELLWQRYGRITE